MKQKISIAVAAIFILIVGMGIGVGHTLMLKSVTPDCVWYEDKICE